MGIPSETQAFVLPGRVEALVVGGGHAGIEAAWCLARLGVAVALVTFEAAGLARMSCNPSVGGLAKGQLAREIDALGGLMGRVIDRTGIHFRLLNRRKGPAVRAPRAQADRDAYSAEVLRRLAAEEHLLILEAEVTEIQWEEGPNGGGPRGDDAPRREVAGATLGPVHWTRVIAGGAHSNGAFPGALPERPNAPRRRGPFAGLPPVIRVAGQAELQTRTIILTVGTFLRGKLHTGGEVRSGGRRGEPSATALSDCLRAMGLTLGRLKTGTPPRLERDSIDFARLAEQPGDEPPPRFSYFEDGAVTNQVVCHITRTTPRTHQILAAALDRSPLYSGKIEGIGPRYCPSIEDKIVRFPERSSHNVFLEPEGLDSNLIYPNGISTSMPADVQREYVRSIPGLEDARIVHPGYAVEYDFLHTSQIDAALEVRGVAGLYAAGQINGTSGYEEAAAQGLMAGMNAYCALSGRGPVILGRSEAYIGVLIDDLVTKVPTEPYRMFTSQSEYRLRLRQDNADQRLAALGHEIGLLPAQEWRRVCDRWDRIGRERERLSARRLGSREIQPGDSCPTATTLSREDAGRSFAELLKRPDVDFLTLRALGYETALDDVDQTAVLAEIKYAGYITKQDREIRRTRALEAQPIPDWLLRDPPVALSREARERLIEHRPATMGQASRIPGVTPSDIFVLAVHIRARR